MLYKYLLYLTCLFSVAKAAYGQAPVNILSIHHGLPKSQIYDIVQDTFGFLWIGTRDGLVRYDGHDMQLYRHGEGDFPFNYAYDLFIDRQHHLWIAGNADYKGAACIDLQGNTIFHLDKATYPTLSNNGITSICQDLNGDMVFITKDFTLNVLAEENNALQGWSLSSLNSSERKVVDVYDVLTHPIHPGAFFISTDQGVFLFDRYSETLITILSNYGSPEENDGWTPSKFFYDSLSHPYVWVGLESKGGLLRIDIDDRNKLRFFGLEGSTIVDQRLQRRKSRSSFQVHDIARKNEDHLFIATQQNGICLFNTHAGQVDFDLHHTKHLEGDVVRVLYTNEVGELWVGADRGGLSYLRPNNRHLGIHLFPDTQMAHQRMKLSSVIDLDDDKYLLAFYGLPQVWIWDRVDDQFEHIDLPRWMYISSMLQVDSMVLLGSNRSVHTLDLSTKEIQINPMQLKADTRNIYDLQRDSSGIWFVVWGEGVVRFQDSAYYFSGSTTHGGLRHRWTHDLVLDPTSDQIWVGQENGLYTIDKHAGTIHTYCHQDSLAGWGNPNFKALTFDLQGRLWTGNFGAGISCFDSRSGQILATLNVSNGLPSDKVYDLKLDHEGFIWVWTSAGLCSFYPDEDLSDFALNYYSDTKFLPLDRSGALLNTSTSGDIFFGVSGGFVHFNPSALRSSTTGSIQPPLVTRIKTPDREWNLLDGTDQIQLKSKQNFFSIFFSAPKSEFFSRQTFSYRLEGVDPQWVQNENVRVASYSSLSPGVYQFHARVGDENGRWSESTKPLTITLAAPWYAGNLAKLLWLMLGGAIILLINRMLINRERMRSQLALQRIEARNLREIDASKSSFFTRISHEFRTPLTVILGMTQQLRKQLNGEPDRIGGLDAIERNGRLLLKQINQILDLSKLQSKSVVLDWRQGNMVSFLRYLAEPFAAYAHSKQISWHFLPAQEEIIMDYEPTRIREVFSNLVSNALKYTGEGGEIKITLEKEYKQGTPYFLMAIHDTGKGIDKAHLGHIFDPYYQVDHDHSGVGTGLGLATTQEWVQAMGGQIWVESLLGMGSTFWVELPITLEAELIGLPAIAQEPLDLVEEQILHDQTMVEKPHILVVEDNLDVQRYLSLCLHAEYAISSAKDGTEGIELGLKEVPDLIITDIMLPGKDGYQVASTLKLHPATNHIPIIMLTAKATQEEKVAGLALGVDAYVTKPFDEEELMIRINGLISQRRLLQKKYSTAKAATPTDDPQDLFLDQIQAYVEEHLQSDFTVEDVAKHLGMSRVQLYRKVKALTGKSISIYIRMIRLYKARQLLHSTNLSISEVAYSVGFSDPSYFTKAFKETFGSTPSALSQSSNDELPA